MEGKNSLVHNLIIPCVAALIITMSCNHNMHTKNNSEFKKLKVGMHKNEVRDILGEPDKIIYGIGKTPSCEWDYSSYKNNALQSSSPSVSFDTNELASIIVFD